MPPHLTSPEPAIDRISPSRRPDRRVVMYQKWRSLLFLHWPFPPEQVRALLPPGLDLDLFGGDAYVGIVPFTMRGVRPVGLPPVPGLSAFHETNVRTYVHVKGRDPGVYFFSLEAASAIAVKLARSLFHLPYHHARMSLTTGPDAATQSGLILHYASERLGPDPLTATSQVTCRIASVNPSPAPPGTLDHFLIERYLLYTSDRGKLCRGQVHHSPYLVQTAEIVTLAETLLAANGLSRPDRPLLAHFSSGLDVEIFSLQTVPGS